MPLSKHNSCMRNVAHATIIFSLVRVVNVYTLCRHNFRAFFSVRHRMKQPCHERRQISMKQHRPIPPVCSPPIHPEGCGCPQCRQQLCNCHPCAECNQPRFLLPRIIASGHIHQRCASVSLQVDGLPDCLRPPLMLVQVSAGCEQPRWEIIPGNRPSQLCVQLEIPLNCQVRDCNGCTVCGTACIDAETMLQLCIPACECWRTNVMVLPCVRMICPPSCSQCSCFDVQLEIAADVHLTRWAACTAMKPDKC